MARLSERMRLALVLLAITATPSVADRLEPEPPDRSGGYQTLVRSVLSEAFEPAVRATVIVEQAGPPEFAVGLKETSGETKIFFVRSTVHIWRYVILEELRSGQSSLPDAPAEIKRLKAALPPDPAKVPLVRCEIAIDPLVANRLSEAWVGMLARVRVNKHPRYAEDGTSYHFSISGLPMRQGFAVSPPPNTDTALLVSTALAMYDYCNTRQPRHLADIRRFSTNLLQRLRSEQP